MYGSVPSRRLGRSLGIDLIPYKTCTYDCVYCQLGRTTDKTIVRSEYRSPDIILEELELKLKEEDKPDYISLAGSGEPTLYKEILQLMKGIKRMTKIPVAVITNGSLLWMDEIREALAEADMVLPSLDAGDEKIFRMVNNPHESISFNTMVDGIAGFTSGFGGKVWLEVLLIADVSGVDSAARISPALVQLNTVLRPPADQTVRPVTPEQLIEFKNYFKGPVEIIGTKPAEDASAKDLPDPGEEAVLSLLARRPCTCADAAAGLSMNRMQTFKHLDSLLARNKVRTVVSGGKVFYTSNKENSLS